MLLSGAAVFSAACGGSGGSDRGSSTAGAPSNTAGASTGGASGAGPVGTAGAGGGSTAACDPTMGCCPTLKCKCPYPAGAATNMVIDDLEDGMLAGWKTATVMTASGLWDFSKDLSAGTIMPAGTPALSSALVAGANGTAKALHVTGTNLTGWGASLAAEVAGGCPFDASAYGGISFYAKGTSAVVEGANKLLILVGMPEFEPKSMGVGFCDDLAMPADPNCYAAHRVLIDLTPDWKQYKIAWSDLHAPTYLTGGPAFNPNRIRTVVFNASGPTPAMAPATSFDFSVDELQFVAPGTMGNVGMPSGGAAGAASTAGAGGASAGAGGASGGAGGATAGTGGTAGG